jgi:glycosyltransferase involved in cell wall biosynthesis
MRLLVVLEADREVTGPAKNLLEFAGLTRGEHFGGPVEVTIANFRQPGDPTGFWEAAQAAGVPVVPISRWKREDRKVVGELVSLVNTLKPDIVQTHALLSHFVARFAGLHRLAPWVAFHHGYTWPTFLAHFYNQADGWSLRAAHRILTPCQAFRNQLRRRGIPAGRISVVYNSISEQWGSNVRSGATVLRGRLGIPAGSRVILTVGRLSREKGHITLLDAVARLRTLGEPHVHLLIVGEGPERLRLEARARVLGLTPHMTLTGGLSAEPYYGLADVFVLPSLSEGSPNVMLEAWATGVPVVATTAGGIPEMASHRKSALLVPPSNSAALAQALFEVLRDPGLASSLASEGQNLVRTRFVPETRARQLLEIYRGVLDGRDPLSAGATRYFSIGR